MALFKLSLLDDEISFDITAEVDTDDDDTMFGLDVQTECFINFLKAQGFGDSAINEALGFAA